MVTHAHSHTVNTHAHTLTHKVLCTTKQETGLNFKNSKNGFIEEMAALVLCYVPHQYSCFVVVIFSHTRKHTFYLHSKAKRKKEKDMQPALVVGLV